MTNLCVKSTYHPRIVDRLCPTIVSATGRLAQTYLITAEYNMLSRLSLWQTRLILIATLKGHFNPAERSSLFS